MLTSLMQRCSDHPRSVGENYLQHWCSAMSFVLRMVGLAVCVFVHAFVPGLFETTGKRGIQSLHRRMVTHRHRDAAAASAETA